MFGSQKGRVPQALRILLMLYREETSDQAAVLHYTYNRFSDLKSRRDRCDCAPTEEDAKRCFILPFDRMVSSVLQSKSSSCRSHLFCSHYVKLTHLKTTSRFGWGLYRAATKPCLHHSFLLHLSNTQFLMKSMMSALGP